MPSSATDPVSNGDASPDRRYRSDTANQNSRNTHTQDHSSARVLGEHEADALAGSLLVSNFHKLEQQNPWLGRHLVENVFGGNFNASIEYREMALLVVAVLIAMGDTTDQLQVYLGAALRHGATRTEILDTINLVSGFTGAPRAVNGLRRIGDALPLHNPERKETVIRLHDHTTLIRDTQGEGVPIILIHCLSLDGEQWRAVLPGLSEAARVIVYDVRGHGKARVAPPTKSLGQLAEDLLEVLDILGVDKADIYGASYGGAVAQYFTLAHPHRVRSMAVIATAAKGNEILRSRATRAEEAGVISLLPESLIRWFLPETIAANDWMVRYARHCLERCRLEDWTSAWRAMADLDTIDRLSEIDVPVLVLCGAQDLSTPPAVMKPHFSGLKHGEYVELNPGTHMLIMEQSRAATEELAAFRKRVDSR